MFQTEFYKLISRRITGIGIAVLMLYLVAWFWISVLGGETVIEDGKGWLRREAIQKDKEIAAPYTGELTVKKVKEIWKKYGPPVNLNDVPKIDILNGIVPKGISINSTQDFVSQFFCEREDDINGGFRYELMREEKIENLLQKDYHFAYTGNWEWFWDAFLMIFIPVCILTMIVISPIFSEEYALRTSDIILTTRHGKERVFVIKTAVALIFSSLLYWIFMGTLVWMHGTAYGWEALKASTAYTHMVDYYIGNSLGNTIFILLLFGWIAILALTLMVEAISIRNRQTFTALVWSVMFYLLPFICIFFILNWFDARLPIVIWLKWLFSCFPALYPARCMETASTWRTIQTAVLFLLGLGAILYGRRKYCKNL